MYTYAIHFCRNKADFHIVLFQMILNWSIFLIFWIIHLFIVIIEKVSCKDLVFFLVFMLVQLTLLAYPLCPSFRVFSLVFPLTRTITVGPFGNSIYYKLSNYRKFDLWITTSMTNVAHQKLIVLLFVMLFVEVDRLILSCLF